MRKVYYVYNPKTRTYDRIYPTRRQRLMSRLRRAFMGVGVVVVCLIVFLLVFGSPSENSLRIENSRLQAQYSVLSNRLDEALTVMGRLQQRDDNLYRVIMQAEPLDDKIRTAGYSSTNRYEEFMDMANSKMVIDNTRKLDALSRQIYIQSKSFDDVVGMLRKHNEMIECIPAIQPVSNKDLKRTASGYGMRVDPIYKTVKFHKGMDFSANTGTLVYATGNGRVIKAGWEGLYGRCINIDHGFGYVTKYAHLSKINVFTGQRIKRGEIIGEVGSTGKSTGPHLHYEVHVKGRVVNPINYYFKDLNAEDYDKMIELANNQGKVYD